MTPSRASGSAVGGARAFAALGGSLVGAALQLQQEALWPAWIYMGLSALGVAAAWWRRMPGRALVIVAFACGAMAGAGLAGWRATAYLDGALDPSLEGRGLRLTGVVSEMPQRSEAGTRFRLDVESARWADPEIAGRPAVPDRIALGWYADGSSLWSRSSGSPMPSSDTNRSPHAGERWQFTVRLRAPHGNRNPHGFDSELWMWEQGLHASGHVRTGARDDAPVLLESTWWHPVERAREAVRDAVFERVPDRARAGVIAALVTGDQGAIDRAGWDVFRATGVAHLMSISGLHVTYMTSNLFLRFRSKPDEPSRDTVSIA